LIKSLSLSFFWTKSSLKKLKLKFYITKLQNFTSSKEPLKAINIY